MQKTLSWMDSAKKFIESHEQAVQWWGKDNSRFVENINFISGQHYTPEELEVFKKKNKAPIVYNYVRPALRTATGLFVQNKYGVKFSPFGPEDQPLSETLEGLNTWNSGQQNDAYRDIDTFQTGWGAGKAYQICFMETFEDGRYRMRTDSINPLSVYFDPNSRHPIIRDDAEYVDIVHWKTAEQIAEMFPDKQEMIDELYSLSRENTNYQATTNKKVDRDHESYDELDGRYKLIERFYKKRVTERFSVTQDGRVDFQDENEAYEYKAKNKTPIKSKTIEKLFQAILIPYWSNTEFVHNDEYHCQPRMVDPDFPDEGQLIFPVIEFCAEVLNGSFSSFTDDQIAPNKMMNGMLSNYFHNVKHSASAPSYLVDVSAFKSEADARLFEKYGSEGDRRFRVKEGRADGAIQPIPQSQPINGDAQRLIELSSMYQEEASAAPKALKGMSQSGQSGVLQEQLMQQAYTQHQQAIANWRMFLKMRTCLRYAYWRQYFTDEKVIRITKPNGKQDFLTINQEKWETDEYGYQTGNIIKWNDINAAPYDIVIEDSQQSPTLRAKNMQIVQSLMQTGAANQDPVLMTMLTMYWLDQNDASQDIKDNFREWSTVVKQQQQAKQQAEQQQQQLDQTQQTQQIANVEAEQTAMPGNLPQQFLDQATQGQPEVSGMPEFAGNPNPQGGYQ
jgi:hypothetical protein